MLRSKVIKPFTSPWISPIVLGRETSNSYHFSSDFRQLNFKITLDSYPLPRMEELIDELGHNSIFTVLDGQVN